MTPEQIEQMKETMDPETHADGFTPFWGYVVSWEKYKDMAEHIIAQREQIEALQKRVKAALERLDASLFTNAEHHQAIAILRATGEQI